MDILIINTNEIADRIRLLTGPDGMISRTVLTEWFAVYFANIDPTFNKTEFGNRCGLRW